MKISTVLHEDIRGRRRYQPCFNGRSLRSDSKWAHFGPLWMFWTAWRSGGLTYTYKYPVLYRSRKRALRVAKREAIKEFKASLDVEDSTFKPKGGC